MTNRPDDESPDKEPSQSVPDDTQDAKQPKGPTPASSGSQDGAGDGVGASELDDGGPTASGPSKDRLDSARRFWTDRVGRPSPPSDAKDEPTAAPQTGGAREGRRDAADRIRHQSHPHDHLSAARSAEEFLAAADEIFSGLGGKRPGADRDGAADKDSHAARANTTKSRAAQDAGQPPHRGSGSNDSKDQAPRMPGPLAMTIGILTGVAILLGFLADTWTEVLWFNQIGFARVIWTRWGTMAGLFFLGLVIAATAVGLAMHLAHRARVDDPLDESSRNLASYREAIEPLWRLVAWGAPPVVGALAGLWELVPYWDRVLLALHAHSFGVTDPQFGLDVSFYVFQLPLLRLAVSFLTRTVVLAGVASVVVHYLYGGISLTRSPHFTRPARLHLTTLLALYSLLRGASYWLGRYESLASTNSKFDGASYTDVNAVLPALAILAAIAVVISGLFVYSLRTESWRLPIIGVVVIVASVLVVGWAYPAVVQQFVVEPNAQAEEAPYIQRNIDATLAAYGLGDVETKAYDARTTVEAGQLKEDAESTTSIRLLDPSVVAPTFQQLQQQKQYYSFTSSMNVDRYQINGVNRDTIVAVRELNLDGLDAQQQTWVNTRTVYTHGFGVVTAHGNTATSDGSPSFWEGGIPSKGDLGEYEPRIYFGRQSPSYSIVGGADGVLTELDYPDDAANGQVNTSFAGDGGPDVGNLWNKLLYAIKFREVNILFSGRVNAGSQILYDRDPAKRVSKVAPWLTLDANPYPAVVDHDDNPATPKRVVWVVDGYTTSNEYPYSQHESLAEVVTDSKGGAALLRAPKQSNYVRNSVKAVVDAYNGSVKLYQWDEQDPVLKAWEQVFPGSVTPMTEMSADLMAHMRYPEDLFKVQRDIMSRYHVKDAAEFYSGGDFWKVPDDPTREGDSPQSPYYLTLQMPGQERASFSLSSAYIIGGKTDRNVLTGFIAVDSETSTGQKGVRSPGYGKLRLLELPRSSNVSGPGQVQNKFNTDPVASPVLTLIGQQGSQVIKGNLLTLPVGGGLLYVQPVYVQSSGGTHFPLLRKVLVLFGDKVGFADTLSAALDQVFDGNSGATTGDQVVDGDSGAANDTSSPGTAQPDTGGSAATPQPSADVSTPAAPAPTADTPVPGTTGDPKADLEKALQDAKTAVTDSDTAMKAGDWAKYGDAQKRLNEAITRAVDAQSRLPKS